jgi:hypothetical protein
MMFRSTLYQPSSNSFSKFGKLQKVHFKPRINFKHDWAKPLDTSDVLAFFFVPTTQHIASVIEEPEGFVLPGDPPHPGSSKPYNT